MRAKTRWVLATAGASLVAFACSFTTSGSGGPGSTPDPFDAAGIPGTGSQGSSNGGSPSTGSSNGGAPSNGSPGTSNGSVSGGTSNGSVNGGGSNSGGTGLTADAG